MGTPHAAIPILEALHRMADIPIVVTRADASRGRSKRLVPPPVKERAVALGLPIAQPGASGELLDVVREARADVAVVAAYGRLITPETLGVPEHGFVNVHYSLLPRWRGASPVVRAILAGDAETGVSIMEMDAGFDTGPVIARRSLRIPSDATTGTLTATLAGIGGELLADVLPRYLDGEIEPEPQDEEQATAAGKVSVDEAHIDPARHSVAAVDRAVRAFDPAPGSWAVVEGDRLKVWGVRPSAVDAEPGWARPVASDVVLGCRDGSLEVVEVQPSGKARISAAAWMNGRRGAPARLE